MFGVSLTELVVLFLVALVLFGPEQLPQFARQLGKIMGELKRGSDAARREFYNAVYPPVEELKREFQAEARTLRALKGEIMAPPSSQPTAKPSAAEVSANETVPPPQASDIAGDPPKTADASGEPAKDGEV